MTIKAELLMEIKSFQDVRYFLRTVEELLLQKESFYNLKLGLGGAIQNNNLIDSGYLRKFI